jgi:Na+/H+-dicarboxylate symporter
MNALGATARGWKSLSLSTRILIGLGLGILAGLFLGEPAAVLQPVADIYIRLMQMTVLPYLVTSLMIAFGQLEPGEAKRLAVRGGILLLLVWIVTCAVLLAIPLAFPPYDSASFFSHSMVEPRHEFSLTDIYFTSNPFASLSQNVVPAVVLFSCLIGIGLMGLKDRENLLAPLRAWNKAIVRITGFVIELTPYGVFAIAAATAGTMDPETLSRLEVYFIAFAAASMLIAFLVLPLLVTAVTPFSYREVTGIARDALLTAFVAHSAFIVMPILIERSKELLEKHGLLDEHSDSAAEVLIPVMFNFPNAGKLLTLLFIPFAAWLAGAPLAGSDYGSLLTAGIPSYFAKAQIALPFLLDLFGLPQDLFQLYIPTTILTGKFDSMVTAMNLLVFALLGAGALGGFLVFRKRRLVQAALGMIGGTAAIVLMLKFGLAAVVDTEYSMDEAVQHMHRSSLDPFTIVHRDDRPPPVSPETAGSRLEMIRARGTLRIGYDSRNLPMSFFNASGELSGFDVELSEMMANSLGLTAEFVPIDWQELPRMLEEGVVDVMPGVWYRPYWFSSLQLTEPYFTATVGFALRDERRHDFDQLEKIHNASGLRVGVPLDTSQLQYVIARYFADSDVELVPVEFWAAYFNGEHPGLDAFLMPVEHAAAWSLLHPEYAAVVPQPSPISIPTAFGIPMGAEGLQHVIDEWVVFASTAGVVDEAYAYWVLGEGARSNEPRWSIMRNVMGWGE